MSKDMKTRNTGVGEALGEPDGEEFAGRFRKGDERAFDGLVRSFQSRIFNLAFRILNSYEDADEATQEIFVKAHRSIGDFEGRCKFGTWLYTVGVNVCRNRLRQSKRRAAFEVRSLDNVDVPGGLPVEASTPVRDCPDGQLERVEMMKLVEKCIAELPAEFAEVIVMRDLQGMSYEEVAAGLDCSLGTVKSRLSRARQAVKEKLRPHLG
ncbi:MAG: sigma-70 family RNA polymerase sigma factor [bacterium]